MNGTEILRMALATSENPIGAVVLKATVVLALGLLFLRVTRRATASVRHRLAAVTFGVLLLLPLAAMFVPKTVVSVPAPVPAAVPVNALTVDEPDVRAHSQVDGTNETNGTNGRGWTLEPVMLVGFVYLGGVALFALSLGGGILRLYRLRARAEVSVAGTRLANEIAEEEGMRRGIEVVVSDELAVPMTFGADRATILLPAETAE